MGEREMNHTKGKHLVPGKGRGKKGLMALLIVLALVVGGYCGLCAYAGASGKLPPRTAVAGLELGGMDRRQARELLLEWLPQRVGSIQVDFLCEGERYTVPGSDFTIDMDTLERELDGLCAGPFFTRGAEFVSLMLGGGDKVVPISLTERPEAVRRAQEEKGNVDGQSSWRETESALILTKGRTGRTVDEAGLMARLEDRARHLINDTTPTSYPDIVAQVSQRPPEPLDFERIHEQVYTVAQTAYFDAETLEIVPSITGRDFDIATAQAAMEQCGEGQTCALPLTLTQPEVTTAELREKLFRDVLGEAVTKVTGTSVRIGNIRHAASLVNGKILLAGEEFSFNQACSPYTVDNGYGKATAYVGGLSKDTVAGGICQMSSTLYWASLKANLETVERYAHAYYPSYIKGGLDATVYGDYGESGSLDFRFKNNTEHPVKLEAYMDGSRYLHVLIHGTDTTGIHGEPYSTNMVVTKQAQVIYEAKEDVPQGTTQKDPERTAYNATTIDTYQKLVDRDGNVVDEYKLYTSKYAVRNAVVWFNPADLALWNIDPNTGLKLPDPTPGPEGPAVTDPAVTGPTTTDPTGPAVTPQPPVQETPVLPEESNAPVLPPQAGETQAVQPTPDIPLPVEPTQPPESTPNGDQRVPILTPSMLGDPVPPADT